MFLENTTRSKFHHAARTHPLALSAAWFTLAGLFLTFPLIAMILLQLATLSLSIRMGVYLFFSAVILPLIIAAAVSVIVGPLILSLLAGNNFRAALYGLIAALASFILWAALLEIIPHLFGISNSGNADGDLFGAAIVVVYLMIIPAAIISLPITLLSSVNVERFTNHADIHQPLDLFDTLLLWSGLWLH
jgi:hypothetical protein